MLIDLEVFLVKNGLIDAKTSQRLVRFCWCSDGPFDIRDFIVKQCFISQVGVSLLICRLYLVNTLRSDGNASLDSGGCTGCQIFSHSIDINLGCMSVMASNSKSWCLPQKAHSTTRRSMNIPAQLKALGLPVFEGRQHSGIDVSIPLPCSLFSGDRSNSATCCSQDSRNIAKIITELALRNVCLLPNTPIRPGRRWPWMGKPGRVLEDRLTWRLRPPFVPLPWNFKFKYRFL